MLTYSILLFFLISYVFGLKKGECIRSNKTAKKVVTCCAFFEMKNGTCTVCEDGFISNQGGSCQSCTGNLYGKRCLNSCECTENQICDPINGCMSLPSTRGNTIVEGSTGLYPWITSSVTELQEIEYIKPKHGSGGPFNQAITIYSVCTACFLVVIAICFIFFKLRKRGRTKQLKDRNRHQNKVQNEPNLILNIQENMASLESIYHEID